MPDYDAFANDFSATRQRPWSEFDLLLPQLRKGDRLLDLGCGNARLRKFLDPVLIPSGHYFGLDASAPLLQIARESFPRDYFFRGDFAQTLPFGADNFEVVTGIASFHHLLSKEDQRHFFHECHRVLKPQGTLFLTTWKLPQKFFWPNILRGRWHNWIIPFGPEKHPRTYRRTSVSILRSLAKKAGFHIQSCALIGDRNFVLIAKK